MKVTDLEVKKDGEVLRCTVTLADGEQIEGFVQWRNPLGMWASPDNEREPAEICAYLRSFAKSIEDAVKAREAA